MIVREFVNLIGFRVNQSEFNKVEARVNALKGRLRSFGRRGTLFITAPFVALNFWLGKTLSDFEQMDVAFETMLGSTKKAKILIEDILQFAAKTPFQIKDIGNVVKQLLATGSEAETVIDDLRILGNAAAGVNVPIQRLALNFGQVRAQGKLTGRELRDFSNTGINVRKELSKMLNVSVSGVQDMVSRGEISFEMLREVFVRMSAEGGIFFDLMIKQSKTLGGLWSNFLDLVTIGARKFTKELLPIFKGIVLWLVKILNLFVNKVNPTMRMVLFWMAAFTAIIPPLVLAFTALVSIGMAVSKILLAVSVAAKAANLSTMAFMARFALMGVAVIAIIALLALLIEDIVIFVRGGKSLIGQFLPPWDELVEKIKESTKVFRFIFSGFIDDLKGMIKGFADFFIGIFTDDTDLAAEGLMEFSKRILSIAGTLAAALIEVVRRLVPVLYKFIETLLASLWQIVKNTINSIIKAILMSFTGLFEKIGTFVEKIPGMKKLSEILRASLEYRPNLAFAGGTGSPTKPGATSITEFNISSNITLPVPEGTAAHQIETLDKTARLAVDEQFRKNIRDLTNSMPEVE